jgi:hypothetical protein
MKKPPSVGAKVRKYPKSWDRLSTATRLEEPLCRMCLAIGKSTIADCVDHIVPKAEGGSIHDPSNLQPLCRKHHDQKTTRDLARGIGRGPHETHIRVVTGPPAAGKSTFVRERRAPGDLVFDWDALASTLFDVPPWGSTREQVEVLRRMRAAILAAAAEGWIGGTTWVIVTDLGQATAIAADANARLDALATPIDACLDRLRDRSIPPERRSSMHAAVTAWHAQHRERASSRSSGSDAS